MTAQRLSRIAAGIAIVTALGVGGLVTRNVLWPDDPDASLQRSGGKMLGDMAGYVGRVDREARTVDISTSPLGIRPIVLLVTNDTAIVVNGKQGAIGDLWKDLPVRVLYEVRDNTRYATSIQVTAGDVLAASPAAKDAAQAPPASSPTVDQPASGATTRETKTPSAPASPAQVSTPAPVASAPPPAAPPTSTTRPVVPPPASAVSPVRPPAPAPVASQPAPVASPPPSVVPPAAPVAQPPATRVAEPMPPKAPAPPAASAPATESASVGSVRAPRPAPAESETDGSAAIDWLLKEAGRR